MVYLPEKYNRNIPDIAHEETEQLLDDIRAELESIYGQAYDEIKVKAENYLEWFKEADKKKREQLKNGDITAEEYKNWRINKMLTGKNHFAMLETISADLANVNGIVASIINGYMPEAYAINGNFTAYTIEKNLEINTAFTLFDEQSVERLIRDKPDLLPKAKLNIPKDRQWNQQNLHSAVVQSIILGETVEETAKRLAAVTDMNQTSAIRNAATMTTSAQNGGRMDGYKRAKGMGIKLKHRWLATLDGHTRESHRAIDGDVVDIGKKFKNGLEYPGDTKGKPEEVYNCRCTTIAAFEDQDFSKFERDNRLRGMSYQQWKDSKGGEPLFRAARNVNRDMAMHEEYRKLLGRKVPAKFKDFQDLKYNNREAWGKMVSDARKERNKRRR